MRPYRIRIKHMIQNIFLIKLRIFIMRLTLVFSTVLLGACGAGSFVAATYVAGSMTSSERINPQIELQDLSKESDPDRWVHHPETRIRRCMLMHAVEYGTAEQFRELLKNGANPKRCKGGPDILFDALLTRAAVQRVGFVDGNRNLQLDAEFLEVFREYKIRPANIQRFLSEAQSRGSVTGINYAINDLGANPNLKYTPPGK